MQNYPQRPQTENRATHARKKEPSLRKVEIRSLQLNPSDWKDFHPAVRGSKPVLSSPLGFACELCLLLVSRYIKASNMKTTLDNGHDHTEFALINHRRRLIYFNARFGKNDGSQIVQNDIPRYKVAVRKSQMK